MVYPVPTGRRLAYDRDGTIMPFILQASLAVTILDSTARRSLNTETNSGYNGNLTPAGYRPGAGWQVWLFPQAMSLTHYMFVTGNVTAAFEWSSNTTDGVNGTWTSIGTTMDSDVPASWRYPRAITGAPITNVRGVRLYSNWGDGNRYIFGAHWYGYPTGSNPDQLQIWHPTLDQRVTIPDLGALAPGVDGSITFRVKNTSLTQTTTSVVVDAEAITDTGPAANADFSLDGSSWSTSVNVGTLAPGDISAIVHVRLNGSDISFSGPRTIRIITTGSL